MVALATPSSAASAKPKHHKSHVAHIQLLTFNDFHGALETGGTIPTSYQLNPDGSPVLDSRGRPVANTVEAGGAAYLAANLARARKGHKYSITAAAGDLIGASPLISAAFHDEPSIDALNDLGLEVSSVGNHEFDEGATELRRMQYGGCRADGDGRTTRTAAPRATRSRARTSATCRRTSCARAPGARCSRRTGSRTSDTASRSPSSA